MAHESLEKIVSLMDEIDNCNGNIEAAKVKEKETELLDSPSDTPVGKIGTLVMVASSLVKEAEDLKPAIDALNNQKKACKSKGAYARILIREIMDRTGLSKVTAGTNNVSIIPAGKKPVNMPDNFKTNPKDNLPPKYWEEVTTITINEDLIRKDIEDGNEIPGITLGEKGTTLRIG